MLPNDITFTSDQEFHMDTNFHIVQLFEKYLNAGGEPKITSFRKHIDLLIKTDLKGKFTRSRSSSVDSSWRSELKEKFSGRGKKWVIVPLSEVSSTISQLEANGVDCNDYKTFTEAQGAAWIRFSGPRLDPNGKQAAAFEVRTEGSTIDHPNQLHFITLDVLDEVIRPMEGTPHSLKFEVIETQEEEDESDPDDWFYEGIDEEELTEFDQDAAEDALIPECF